MSAISPNTSSSTDLLSMMSLTPRRQLLGNRLFVFPLIFLATGAMGILLGKDVNWDQLQHHFYLGFSALHDRFGQDYLPTSVQSYLVPYGYAPFYLLASSTLDDRVVAFLLALLSAPALCAVWELGGRLTGVSLRPQREFSPGGAWAGLILAALAPVFFVQVGSSFMEAPLAGLVLWGFVCLVALATPSSPKILLTVGAAILLGSAAALKLPNLLFAITALPLLLFAVSEKRLRLSVVYAGAGVATFVVVSGWWYWRVLQTFGNPFFPFFNRWFRSELAPFENIGHFRFVPIDFYDAIIRPVWMISPERFIYTDPPAPDIRFLVVFLLGFILIGALGMRPKTADSSPPHQERPSRLMIGSWAVFLLSWVGWLTVSGNGRYFMPIVLFVASLIVATVVWISPARRWVVYTLGAIIGAQMALVVMGSPARYGPSEWTGRWFEVDVPEGLRNQPAVFLSLSMEPAAFLVPHLHRRSSFVSVGSQLALSTESQGWSPVAQLLESGRPIWLVATVDFAEGDGAPSRPREKELRNSAARLGLDVEFAKCVDITLAGMPTSVLRVDLEPSGETKAASVDSEKKFYVACPALQATSDLSDFRKREQAASIVFDQLARQCPLLFPPPHPATESRGDAWWRFYVGSDASIWIDKDVVYFHRVGLYQLIKIGSVEDVLQGKASVPCNRDREEPIVASSKLPWWWGFYAVFSYAADTVSKDPSPQEEERSKGN